MKIPQDLLYTAEHVWLRQEDDLWLTGITDYAQDMLGDVVFVELPAVGSSVHAQTPCGLVESVKTGADLHAPIDGEVVAINPDVAGNPELLNDKPYQTWLYKIRPHHQSLPSTLLNANDYQQLLG